MQSASTGSATWREVLQANRQQYTDELVDLLRIPSVSTSDEHIEDVRRCAIWVADRMKRAAIEHVEVLPTGPHQCVYGDWLHAEGKPTILIYGHFDVQPPDPLELWESPPFEPVIKNGRIYARGASDMKGNLVLCIAAVEALLAADGALPVNVKFLFEGQEEIGSCDLGPFIDVNREMLACDAVLSADGLQWAEDQPSLFLGVKGMCGLDIQIDTAQMDLHSGLYGGAVPNALHALVQLLSTMRDSDGNIVVKGFYDQVIPISDNERLAMNSVPFDATSYCQEIGISALVGEPGYTTYERAWARPTLELNGVWGGYQGEGVKTVIPAKANAKITCRLVAEQDPGEVLSKLQSHIEAHAPKGAKVTVTRQLAQARAYAIPIDHPCVKAAAGVLATIYGREPYFVRVGGSLPITDLFLQSLNVHTVTVGFALPDERAHSPNEFLRLADFERGQEVYALILEQFGLLDKSTLAAKRA